jgi:LmbE family N-acetylglucosaminyl deacetylase
MPRNETMSQAKRTLVVAAHPDDEVLGCGGTVARLVNEKHPVWILILGEGVTSRFKRREDADSAQVQELQIRARKVSNLLGVQDLFLRDLPDNRFDTVALLDIVKTIEETIEKCLPEVIFTHHGGDLNADHRIVHQAVLAATRPMDKQGVREIYAFETPSASEWSFGQMGHVFRPNVFVDVSRTLSRKLDALLLYDTELRPFPHPRSAEALTALAQYRGSTAGLLAAEAFELVRAIR